MQRLLQRGGQPARPLSTGVWRGKTQLSSSKLQGVEHRAAQGAEEKAPGGACALERRALGLGSTFVWGERLISPSDKLD